MRIINNQNLKIMKVSIKKYHYLDELQSNLIKTVWKGSAGSVYSINLPFNRYAIVTLKSLKLC